MHYNSRPQGPPLQAYNSGLVHIFITADFQLLAKLRSSPILPHHWWYTVRCCCIVQFLSCSWVAQKTSLTRLQLLLGGLNWLPWQPQCQILTDSFDFRLIFYLRGGTGRLYRRHIIRKRFMQVNTRC